MIKWKAETPHAQNEIVETTAKWYILYPDILERSISQLGTGTSTHRSGTILVLCSQDNILGY